MIDKKRLLERFFHLVRIASPTGDERAVADVVIQELTRLGLSVDEDDVAETIGGNTGNLYAFLPGTLPNAPRIMLNAHLDTVEPATGIQPRLQDGIITSAGDTILGADCKSGLAAILEALTVLVESRTPHGDVQAVFTVAEEGGVNGSKNLDPARLRADLGFVFDTDGPPGRAVVSAPGKDRLDVTIHGKKAHAGICPEEGVNAIMAAATALAGLPMGRIDSQTTANVGCIRGGQSVNVVPDAVSFRLETRSRDTDALTALTDSIRQSIERAAAGCGAQAVIWVTREYAPYRLPEGAPQLVLVSRAMADVGLEPVFAATGGGSDANFFNAFGLPTVVLSNGMTKAHTLEESLSERDLYKTAELALALLLTAAKTDRDSLS